jgi:hypothetical protein
MTMHCLIGPQLREILSAIEEIAKPYILGSQLGIEPYQLT